jgi:hypothetical protein
VVRAIRPYAFRDSQDYTEIIPILISLIENLDGTFNSDEISDIRDICLSQSRKASRKSKKLYLALQLLLTKDTSEMVVFSSNDKNFNPKVFLKSKALAKLFIRFFISTYYSNSNEEQRIDGQATLELLSKSLKSKSGDRHRSNAQIINYVYSEILSYDIVKQGYESFENMNLYSIIYDVFQNTEFKVENKGGIGQMVPHRQINFFLQVYSKSLGFLSRVSPESMATSLKLILANTRSSQLFTDDSKLYAHKIVDKLYY